jgi:hypothetical protein
VAVMGDVIKFPSNAQQGLAFLEDGVRDLMLSKGENEASIEITLNILKDVYRQYGDIGQQYFQIKLPPYLKNEHIEIISQQVTDGIQMLNKEHARVINKLASELVLTKLELYKYKNRQAKD